MADTGKVQESIKEFSKQDIDTFVKTDCFQEEVEEAIRGHIHLEYQTWFLFRKLGSDCLRSNVSLHGFASLWKRSAAECFADATWLESYLVQRGGGAKPSDIPAPKISWPDDPVDPIQPVHEALKAEKSLLEVLLRLCKTADKFSDNALEDMIETRFLRKETRHVKDMADLLQQCVRVSKQPGHGLYHLDKELRTHGGVTPWASYNDPDTSDKLLHKTTEALYNTSV